jgi:hypothetical protein
MKYSLQGTQGHSETEMWTEIWQRGKHAMKKTFWNVSKVEYVGCIRRELISYQGFDEPFSLTLTTKRQFWRAAHNSDCSSTFNGLSIYLSLCSPCDLGRFFSFLIYAQSVGLLGRGISPNFQETNNSYLRNIAQTNKLRIPIHLTNRT